MEGNVVKIEDKLYLVSFKPDEHMSHLIVRSQEVCRDSCDKKYCTLFCPAQVYKWEGEQLTVGYQACLECGACRIGCPFSNIEWCYPRGGFGLAYKYG
jgi:ferredoxin like protein